MRRLARLHRERPSSSVLVPRTCVPTANVCDRCGGFSQGSGTLPPISPTKGCPADGRRRHQAVLWDNVLYDHLSHGSLIPILTVPLHRLSFVSKRTVHNTEEFDFLREITRDCRDDEPDPDPSRSNNSPKKSKRARAAPPADSGSSSDSPYETDDASADADFEAKGTRAKMRLNMIMNSSDAE